MKTPSTLISPVSSVVERPADSGKVGGSIPLLASIFTDGKSIGLNYSSIKRINVENARANSDKLGFLHTSK